MSETLRPTGRLRLACRNPALSQARLQTEYHDKNDNSVWKDVPLVYVPDLPPRIEVPS